MLLQVLPFQHIKGKGKRENKIKGNP